MSRKPIMQFTQCNKIEDEKGVINDKIASIKWHRTKHTPNW